LRRIAWEKLGRDFIGDAAMPVVVAVPDAEYIATSAPKGIRCARVVTATVLAGSNARTPHSGGSPV
jgi:hypothetical protein